MCHVKKLPRTASKIDRREWYYYFYLLPNSEFYFRRLKVIKINFARTRTAETKHNIQRLTIKIDRTQSTMKDSNSTSSRPSSSHTYIPMNSFVFSIPDDVSRSLSTSRRLEPDLFQSSTGISNSPLPQRKSFTSQHTIEIIDMALSIVNDIVEEEQPTTKTKQ